jgi:AAA domain
MQNVPGATNEVNTLNGLNGVSAPLSRWDFAEDEAPLAFRETPVPRDDQKTETEWKRWSRLYGKDLLGIIPPGAETAPHLRRNRGKIPGYKANDGSWFGRTKPLSGVEADTSLDELKKWAADGAGIGIMGRTCCGLDNDASNRRIRDGLREIIHKHVAPGPRRGRPNSFRDLHMLLGPGLKSWQIKYQPPGKPKDEKPDLLELKAGGTYYNVEGPHPSGVMYTWENGHPCDGRGADGLPKMDDAISEQIRADAITYLKAEGCEIVEGRGPSPSGQGVGASASRKVIGDPSLLAPSLEALADALKGYPNTPENVPAHPDFVRFTAAVKAASDGDEDFYADVFEDWALTYEENTPEYVRKTWDSVTDAEIGWSWLADRTGYNTPERAFADGPSPEYLDDAPPLAADTTRKAKPFPFQLFSEAGQSPEFKDFVEDTLNEGQTSLWFGKSGAGKTFVVSYLAMCVALGWKWHGREVERGAVVYVACEGSGGLRRRLAAFRKHYGIDKTEGALLAIISATVNLRNRREVDRLIETIKEIASCLGAPIQLIVIDTLSRAMAGGNENSPDDMGALVNGVDRLGAGTGAHVALIHHSGKDVERGARGHSILRAAVDSEFEIERTDNGLITVTTTKQRDLDEGKPLSFKLHQVPLGTNWRGKPIGSCVVEPAEALPAAKTKKLPPTVKEALDILREMLAGQPEAEGEGEGIVKVTDWRDAVFARLEQNGVENPATRRMQFMRARRTLDEAGMIETQGDDVTVPWTAWASGR